jgi:hypothetical protein
MPTDGRQCFGGIPMTTAATAEGPVVPLAAWSSFSKLVASRRLVFCSGGAASASRGKDVAPKRNRAVGSSVASSRPGEEIVVSLCGRIAPLLFDFRWRTKVPAPQRLTLQACRVDLAIGHAFSPLDFPAATAGAVKNRDGSWIGERAASCCGIVRSTAEEMSQWPTHAHHLTNRARVKSKQETFWPPSAAAPWRKPNLATLAVTLHRLGALAGDSETRHVNTCEVGSYTAAVRRGSPPAR